MLIIRRTGRRESFGIHGRASFLRPLASSAHTAQPAQHAIILARSPLVRFFAGAAAAERRASLACLCPSEFVELCAGAQRSGPANKGKADPASLLLLAIPAFFLLRSTLNSAW